MEYYHLYWKSILAVYTILILYYFISGKIIQQKITKKLVDKEQIIKITGFVWPITYFLPFCIALAFGCEIPNMIKTHITFGFEQYFLLIFVFILPSFIILSLASIRLIVTNKRIMIRSSFEFLNINSGLKNLQKNFFYTNITVLTYEEKHEVKCIKFKYDNEAISLGVISHGKKIYEIIKSYTNIAK